MNPTGAELPKWTSEQCIDKLKNWSPFWRPLVSKDLRQVKIAIAILQGMAKQDRLSLPEKLEVHHLLGSLHSRIAPGRDISLNELVFKKRHRERLDTASKINGLAETLRESLIPSSSTDFHRVYTAIQMDNSGRLAKLFSGYWAQTRPTKSVAQALEDLDLRQIELHLLLRNDPSIDDRQKIDLTSSLQAMLAGARWLLRPTQGPPSSETEDCWKVIEALVHAGAPLAISFKDRDETTCSLLQMAVVAGRTSLIRELVRRGAPWTFELERHSRHLDDSKPLSLCYFSQDLTGTVKGLLLVLLREAVEKNALDPRLVDSAKLILREDAISCTCADLLGLIPKQLIEKHSNLKQSGINIHKVAANELRMNQSPRTPIATQEVEPLDKPSDEPSEPKVLKRYQFANGAEVSVAREDEAWKRLVADSEVLSAIDMEWRSDTPTLPEAVTPRALSWILAHHQKKIRLGVATRFGEDLHTHQTVRAEVALAINALGLQSLVGIEGCVMSGPPPTQFKKYGSPLPEWSVDTCLAKLKHGRVEERKRALDILRSADLSLEQQLKVCKATADYYYTDGDVMQLTVALSEMLKTALRPKGAEANHRLFIELCQKDKKLQKQVREYYKAGNWYRHDSFVLKSPEPDSHRIGEWLFIERYSRHDLIECFQWVIDEALKIKPDDPHLDAWWKIVDMFVQVGFVRNNYPLPKTIRVDGKRQSLQELAAKHPRLSLCMQKGQMT